jgi:nucleoid-associated protein YgaU
MKILLAAIMAGGLLASTGCVTLMDQNALAQQQADMERLAGDVQRVKERLNGLELEQQNIVRELEAARRAPREDVVVRNRLETLERQAQALAAARDADRKQIVTDLSHKMAAIVGSSGGGSSGRSSGGGAVGYEHVVESGQSLSAIAAAYKVTVSSIKRANNMKSDTIRVGQTLVIPKH